MKYAALVDSCLAVGDDRGNLAVIGCDGDVIWEKKTSLGDGGFVS